MRVVAGRFKGRQIHAPKGEVTRPTSDRVRQAVFNILEHGLDGVDLEGPRVIDLFAGTGALGLEALSRGARFCLFVEESASARAAIRQNVEALGLTGVTRIWRRDATRLGPAAPMAPFDLAFLDPPYGRGLGEAALAALREGGWLRPGALALLEADAGDAIATPDGFAEMDRRAWGDTQAVFLKRA